MNKGTKSIVYHQIFLLLSFMGTLVKYTLMNLIYMKSAHAVAILKEIKWSLYALDWES